MAVFVSKGQRPNHSLHVIDCSVIIVGQTGIFMEVRKDRTDDVGGPPGEKMRDNGKRRCAMGDKGKKDKDKGRKQKINKQDQKTKEKIAKQPKRTP